MDQRDFPCEETILELEHTVPADVQGIEDVVSEIMEAIDQSECSRGKEFEIELALREALANAILHGAKGDPTQKVTISVACAESQGVLIVVSDPGHGFEINNVPDPLMGRNIYSNHGRGIYLINELMDEVRFEKGGTEIHMVKRP